MLPLLAYFANFLSYSIFNQPHEDSRTIGTTMIVLQKTGST